jgi:hypothetical protein
MKGKLWEKWQKNVVSAAWLLVTVRWEVKLKVLRPERKMMKKRENEKKSEILFCGFHNKGRNAPQLVYLFHKKNDFSRI